MCSKNKVNTAELKSKPAPRSVYMKDRSRERSTFKCYIPVISHLCCDCGQNFDQKNYNAWHCIYFTIVGLISLSIIVFNSSKST